ncbi:MarR family transcriptional regulator,transcriptional regulator for hemolysin [Novosphingobium pentaromativorans US6-1]|uniref:MarR family transcriptional regulator,transcriptional regulator for hemolysin n=1 Tax=Novosphingobium pentaromativorans US6-1 TaxID=1088721 RepID=G6EIW0_9SPHN|nr:MarR family transcriptional regulator,transcriptional regulator for hemolysin [Novosphingobium pentaromativorans US6-1]
MGPVARAWQQLGDAALASLEVSNSAGWALVHLLRMGGDVRQGDLARKIGITEPSLVRTLDRLEEAQLLERRADEQDRRAKHVRLTPVGTDLGKRIDARLVAVRGQLLADFGDAELATVVDVLERLSDRIAEAAERL